MFYERPAAGAKKNKSVNTTAPIRGGSYYTNQVPDDSVTKDMPTIRETELSVQAILKNVRTVHNKKLKEDLVDFRRKILACIEQ